MNSFSVISLLNESEQIFLLTSFVIIHTQLNDFNNCYQTIMILFNINHLFADTEVVTSIVIKH